MSAEEFTSTTDRVNGSYSNRKCLGDKRALLLYDTTERVVKMTP